MHSCKHNCNCTPLPQELSCCSLYHIFRSRKEEVTTTCLHTLLKLLLELIYSDMRPNNASLESTKQNGRVEILLLNSISTVSMDGHNSPTLDIMDSNKLLDSNNHLLPSPFPRITHCPVLTLINTQNTLLSYSFCSCLA